MTGLIVEIHMPGEDVKFAGQMEENYSNIHRKFLWEPGAKLMFDRGILESLFPIPTVIFTNISREKKFDKLSENYFRVLDSFREKVHNSNGREYYVDNAARENKIPLPEKIEPLKPHLGGPGSIGPKGYLKWELHSVSYQTMQKLGCSGIEFYRDQSRFIEYIRGHGNM